MRNQSGLALAFALFATVPTFARQQGPRHQEPKREEGRHEEGRHEERNPPRANGGRIPAPPPERRDPHAPRETERFEDGRHNDHPHVNNDHWYGHERGDDKRFHLEHPWEHGRFERFGPSYRYNVIRIDLQAHRFWFPGGFFFEVAPWDWGACSNWCWNCSNDFVVYEDFDHFGWYLLYNVHTGIYVHVLFLGY